MKPITLTEIPVQFIENRQEGLHKYVLGLEELTGVTTILKQVIFRDKYTGIDETVLRNAADRGTAIHEAVQSYMLGQEIFDLSEDLKPFLVDATQARGAWIADAERRGMRAVAVEYLVSDCKEVATKIDVVLPSGENMVDLSDIKTTYQLDEDYLSWQLSTEKYFFEKQNPNLKVNRLLAFWYNKTKKEWQIREIKDKGTTEVERLLNAWRNGEYWGMPAIGADVPTPLRSVAEFYAEIEYKIKEYTAQRDEFRSRLQALMEEHNVPQVKLEGFTCTYVGETERKGFDYKRLIEEHPELWDGLLEEYQTTTRVKPSLKITLK